MSDRQWITLAASYDIKLTAAQATALRPILAKATFSWAITGIPARERKQIIAIIGEEAFQQLMRMLP